MAMVNGETYFAFADATSDKFNHFRLLVTNFFCLEDLWSLGDHDYNDLVLCFDFMLGAKPPRF
jgi:hypothetical protein